MQYEYLTPTNPTSTLLSPGLEKKQVHAGKTLIYPENTPKWELFNKTLLCLAQRTASRTKAPFAFSIFIAAIALNLPVYGIPRRLDVIYFDGKHRGTSRVGVIKGAGGKPVHRHLRSFPKTAVKRINGLPVLAEEYLLLEFLLLPCQRYALITADAIARKIINPHRCPTLKQKNNFISLKTNLMQLAKKHYRDFELRLIAERLDRISLQSESPLESMVSFDLREIGILDFEQQFPVRTENTIYYTDFCIKSLNFPQLPNSSKFQILLECDGDGKYLIDIGKLKERFRQEAIIRAGFTIVRVSWKEATSPEFKDILRGRIINAIYKELIKTK